MSKVKIELNLKGLNALMKSEEMQSVLNQAADKIAAAAGDGYEIEEAHPIRYIAISSVRAATFKARRDNLKNNTLLKAMGSVKL